MLFLDCRCSSLKVFLATASRSCKSPLLTIERRRDLSAAASGLRPQIVVYIRSIAGFATSFIAAIVRTKSASNGHQSKQVSSKHFVWRTITAVALLDFSHMAIMALANMIIDHARSVAGEGVDLAEFILANEPKFFRLDTEIIPFFDENWESLTSLPRRVKTTWHGTIAKTLAKETELFVNDEADENLFTLKERDLLTIGPLHKSVKNVRSIFEAKMRI